MKRFLLVLAIVGGIVALALGRDADRDGSARVDVVFDTAKGMVPGQIVKVAGARAGKVIGVRLTARRQARVELEVDAGSAPFYADARCRILPEGPISENYIDCNPGTPRSGELRASSSGIPTVPVARTTTPVSIQDLLQVFAAPTDSQLRLLLNELGVATSGRGEDLNAVLRRTNPALTQTRGLLRVVNGQRGELQDAIAQTDTVLADLAERKDDVRRFVDATAVTMSATARRRTELEDTVRELPSTLRATRRGLRSIDRATTAGTPLLASLQQAAPPLAAVNTSLRQFAEAGSPAVRAAAAAAAEGRRTIPSTLTVARQLQDLGRIAQPSVTNLKRLLTPTRDSGGIENLLRVGYSMGNLASLKNGVSHIITLFVGLQTQCLVKGLSVPGCDHRFLAPGKGRIPVNDPDRADAQQRTLRAALDAMDRKDEKGERRAPSAKPADSAALAPPTKTAPPSSSTPAASAPADPVQSVLDGLQGLLDPPAAKPEPEPGASPGTADALLDFLLG